jgi:CMP-N-acetylneuraminic acid synthetase|tara:strand:+ start:241 stop:918 length:678 start_codon:yes stop_codon:yes gene_type:complete
MKDKKDICVLVQARLGSQRVPRKMIRPFCETTLVDVLFNKLKCLKSLPQSNIYFSAYEDELKEIANNHGINIYHRSEASAKSEGQPLSEIYEWYDKLPFKYVILVSACNPLLEVETIDSFIDSFIESDKEGAFAVFPKKTYYWDEHGNNLTDWKGSTIMNTKFVDPVYEAAHCLYASRMDIIGDGNWMDTKSPPEPHLVEMQELEAFDIDYEWQFKIAELLYKNL